MDNVDKSVYNSVFTPFLSTFYVDNSCGWKIEHMLHFCKKSVIFVQIFVRAHFLFHFLPVLILELSDYSLYYRAFY